jgi:GNAT superfamily N-acetyltransferase
MTDFLVVATEEPEEADRAAIVKPLVAFNDSQVGERDFRVLALLVKDADGSTIGGLWAKSVYDWLFVELLVVPERLRGQGVGADLMRRAEMVAAARGCVGVWLDTFSFQARPFYERLGYSVFGTLEDNPRGGARFFMQKRLVP